MVSEYDLYVRSVVAQAEAFADIESTKVIGEEKGIEKSKVEAIKNLLIQTDFTIDKIASLANVTLDFVYKVSRLKMEKYLSDYEKFLNPEWGNDASFTSAAVCIEKARKEGQTHGREQGKMEGLLKVVINAKQMGMTVADISKLTGLTKKEINKLRL